MISNKQFRNGCSARDLRYQCVCTEITIMKIMKLFFWFHPTCSKNHKIMPPPKVTSSEGYLLSGFDKAQLPTVHLAGL